MKFLTIKSVLTSIEIFGVVVLLLVLLAISSTNIQWQSYDLTITTSFQVMLFMIICSAVSSFGRILKVWDSKRFLIVWGLLFFLVGSSVLVFVPEFFHAIRGIPYGYWYKVSLYSMPAICIEGGIFSLYYAYVQTYGHKKTTRESVLMVVAFILYATCAVTINFLAISEYVSTAQQIVFSKTIIAGVIMVTTAYFITKRNDY